MLKRIFDVSIALIALILLLPIYILVAYRVRKNFGAPVLFRQARSGLNGEVFEILKFRTMSDDKDSQGNLLPDEHRLTDFGKQLRASSLDELPQLWNVLRGDMSIVGPRPQLMEYLPLYNTEQFRRHLVRPGITGYAQINGRNNISWEKRFELDVWYVDNRSMWLYIKILFKTVKLVIAKHGICAEGEATMSRFIGNKQQGHRVVNANIGTGLSGCQSLNRHFSERDANIYFDIKYQEATSSVKAADDPENQIGGFGVRLSLAPLVSVPVGIYDQYMCKDQAGSLPAKDMYLAGVDDYASAAHGQPYKLYA